MAERRRGGRRPEETFILDSGFVIGYVRQRAGVRSTLRQIRSQNAPIVVPPIVVTETYRGSARDALIDQLLARVVVPEVDLALAKDAGRLLGAVGGSNAADAQVVAEALRRIPCAILTGDPDDIRRLVAGRAGIRVLDINQL